MCMVNYHFIIELNLYDYCICVLKLSKRAEEKIRAL